jgi:hypothetical protein
MIEHTSVVLKLAIVLWSEVGREKQAEALTRFDFGTTPPMGLGVKKLLKRT